MIAQIIASKYPERTSSLVSLMSSPRIPKVSEILKKSRESPNMENIEAKSAQDYGFYPRALPRNLRQSLEPATDRYRK